MIIVTISHIINILVAGGMSILLLKDAPTMSTVYGPKNPARSILASLYFAIAVTSLFALITPNYSIMIATVLFPLQIIYKLSTIVTLGKITHPVVLSNIFISLIHGISLIVIFS